VTVLFKLKKGEVSAPVFTQEGCFLLYVEDRNRRHSDSRKRSATMWNVILAQQMTRQTQGRWIERLRRNGYYQDVLGFRAQTREILCAEPGGSNDSGRFLLGCDRKRPLFVWEHGGRSPDRLLASRFRRIISGVFFLFSIVSLR